MPYNSKIRVENVVATFKLNKRLNLEKIHKEFRGNSVWDEKIFRKKGCGAKEQETKNVIPYLRNRLSNMCWCREHKRRKNKAAVT